MAVLVVFSFIALIVAIVFIFVTVVGWAGERRKEREAFYHHETYRKLLEQPGTSAGEVLRMMREEQQAAARRRLEGMKLGGMITAAVGLAMLLFLRFEEPEDAAWLISLIPLLIGVVLFVYAAFLAPRPEEVPGSPGDHPGGSTPGELP